MRRIPISVLFALAVTLLRGLPAQGQQNEPDRIEPGNNWLNFWRKLGLSLNLTFVKRKQPSLSQLY